MGWKTLQIIMRKLLLFIGAAFTLLGCNGVAPLEIGYDYPGDTRMWDHFFEVAGEYKFESSPLGVILPHHLMAAESIAKFYKGLSKVSDPSVIFIIGPNHYENGEANIQTCEKCVFSTIDGNIEVDKNLTEKLVEDNVAEFLDETFIKEHAIFSHTPFIKRFFPDAKIVPILIQWKIPIEQVKNLSRWLDTNLPKDALVIASVDFSHYQPLSVSDFHDQSSYTSIKNFDFLNIYDLEIDSPSSIYAILDLMKRRGYMKASRLEHTSVEGTSHQYWAFYEGDIEPVDGMSIMFFGNSSWDLSSLGRTAWNWDRSYDERKDDGVKRFFRDIKGEEDRFLNGSDYYIFGDVNCDENFGISLCSHDNGKADIIYEVIDGRLFIYSLGDFIVGGDSEGVILGVYVTPEEFYIYEYPIEVRGGYPRLKDAQKDVVKFER